MSDKETLEYLKQQVQFTHGISQNQRERWFIIKSIHSLHEKVNRIEKLLQENHE